jgi:hypothetical protein
MAKKDFVIGFRMPASDARNINRAAKFLGFKSPAFWAREIFRKEYAKAVDQMLEKVASEHEQVTVPVED